MNQYIYIKASSELNSLGTPYSLIVWKDQNGLYHCKVRKNHQSEDTPSFLSQAAAEASAAALADKM